VTLQGRAWRFGDDIKAGGQIIATKYDNLRNVGDWGASHAMEDIDPNFASNVRQGDIMFAGRSFGWGHGHYTVQAVRVLMNAGIACVVAESFGAGYDRKAINTCGFPVLANAELPSLVSTGDEVEIDLEQGMFRNRTSGVERHFSPLPPVVLDILAAKGLESYTLRKLGKSPAPATK
jgi:3-isopropylmalate/(R)-2-methylmalate dehydratase small subunit